MKKFYFFLVALMVGFAANAENYLNVPGTWNGWGDNGVVIGDNGIGVNKIDNVKPGDLFKIKIWDGETHWYGNGQTLALDTEYTLGEGEDMTIPEGAPSTIWFKWDYNTNTLTLCTTEPSASEEEVEPGDVDYYLSGAFTGWGDRKFELVDGVLTSWANCLFQDAFGVRVYAEGAADDEKAWYWVAGDEATVLTESGSLQLVKETEVAGVNPELANGYWTLTLDPETMTLNAVRSDYRQEYQLRGEYSNWGTWMSSIDYDGDNVVFVVDSWPGGEFKIWYKEGDTEYWMGCNDAIENGKTYQTSGDYQNMLLPEAANDKKVTILFNRVNHDITISWGPTTGIEAIDAEDAAPVYYNLQGVRVNNPQSGLYIMVRGNKVSKVLVK